MQTHILAALYGGVYLCIYGPLLVYHLTKFHAKRSSLIYVMRFCNITIIQGVIHLLYLILQAAHGLTCMYGLYGYKSRTERIFESLEVCLGILFLYCFVWR